MFCYSNRENSAPSVVRCLPDSPKLGFGLGLGLAFRRIGTEPVVRSVLFTLLSITVSHHHTSHSILVYATWTCLISLSSHCHVVFNVCPQHSARTLNLNWSGFYRAIICLARYMLSPVRLSVTRMYNKKAQLSLTNPRDAKTCQKLLQFDVLTTLSLAILAYLHSFCSCCVRNLRNPAKFTENSNLWSSRSSKVILVSIESPCTTSY